MEMDGLLRNSVVYNSVNCSLIVRKPWWVLGVGNDVKDSVAGGRITPSDSKPISALAASGLYAHSWPLPTKFLVALS